jgi:sortase A
VERLLLVAGAGALVWCAVLVGDGVLAQRRARQALDTVTPAARPLLPSALGEPGAAPPDSALPRGAPLAALSVPRIELSAVVLHGSDAQTLRRGPGHLEHTALPGDAGNMVIAGHRDSFFRKLRHIRPGDDVYLDAPRGTYHYRVTWVRIVNPHEIDVLRATNDAVLTLITCYPFWALGSAPDRFVVRAVRVSQPAAAAIHVPVQAPSDRRSVNTPKDDETAVRELVEGYLTRYQAAPFVTHRRCEVDVSVDAATVDCERRTFLLDRSAGAWAIRSIVLR